MPLRHSPAMVPGRVRGRLVPLALAVLIGLLAMHGLMPGTAAPYMPAGTEHSMAPSAAVTCAPVDEQQAIDAHAHPDQGGHAEHADAECAAGGVTSPPPLGPPLSALLPPRTDPLLTTGPLGNQPSDGRAPPSLSELQLLRI